MTWFPVAFRPRLKSPCCSTPKKYVTYLTYARDRLQLHDGRILRTRISHPVNRETYGERRWAHILRDQLGVDQATFWVCVQDGKKPDRGAPEAPPEALAADLVHLLLTRVRLSEVEVAAMSKEEAIARMQRYWATDS